MKCFACDDTGKINVEGEYYDYCDFCPHGNKLYNLDTFEEGQ